MRTAQEFVESGCSGAGMDILRESKRHLSVVLSKEKTEISIVCRTQHNGDPKDMEAGFKEMMKCIVGLL